MTMHGGILRSRFASVARNRIVPGAILMPSIGNSQPYVDGYAEFDGASALQLPDSQNFNVDYITDGFSVSAWCWVDDYTVAQPIAYKQGEFLLTITASGKLAAYVYDAEGDYIGKISTASISPQYTAPHFQWFGFTYNASTKTISLMSSSIGAYPILVSTTNDNSGTFGDPSGGSNPLQLGYNGSGFYSGIMRGFVYLNNNISSNTMAYFLRNSSFDAGVGGIDVMLAGYPATEIGLWMPMTQNFIDIYHGDDYGG